MKGCPIRLSIGLAAGVAIAYVDNVAFKGEASPILIVALLLIATGTSGAIWEKRAWIAAAATWMCVPSVHLVKHILGLPDTLQPNTYASILLLAVFTFVIAAVGTGFGVLVHTLKKKDR
jgi:hypothetical protein